MSSFGNGIKLNSHLEDQIQYWKWKSGGCQNPTPDWH